MLESAVMGFSDVVQVVRLIAAVLGLALVGRMLATARTYLSWRAFAYYGLALAVLLVIGLLQFWRPVFVDPLALSRVLQSVLVLSVMGALYEQVRADRQRQRDAQRLMEQWRLASSAAEKRARELEVLSQVTSQLVSSLDLRQVIQVVVDQALALGGADAVTVYVSDPETGALRHHGITAVAPPYQAVNLPVPRPNGLTATVARTGEPIFITDIRSHPLYQTGHHPSLQSIASVPLRLEGQAVGVMNASYARTHTFDADEVRLFNALAAAAALAVRNATLHERISNMAVTDELTGLINRRRFLELLHAEVQRARRYERPISLLMLDLDNLKPVNDRYGHAAGDLVLRGVAQCLRQSLRETDVPARLGGDEFAVLLPETGEQAALAIAERIRICVGEQQVEVEGGRAGATLSIGLVSRLSADLTELPRILHQADEAMYEAKAAGRNQVAVAESPDASPAAA